MAHANFVKMDIAWIESEIAQYPIKNHVLHIIILTDKTNVSQVQSATALYTKHMVNFVFNVNRIISYPLT